MSSSLSQMHNPYSFTTRKTVKMPLWCPVKAPGFWLKAWWACLGLAIISKLVSGGWGPLIGEIGKIALVAGSLARETTWTMQNFPGRRLRYLRKVGWF